MNDNPTVEAFLSEIIRQKDDPAGLLSLRMPDDLPDGTRSCILHRIEALAEERKNTWAPGTLLILLGHCQSTVRAGALRGLAFIRRGDGCIQYILRAVADPDPEVRDAAAFALESCQTPGAEELLWHLLAAEETMVQFSAAYSLKQTAVLINKDKYLEELRDHEILKVRCILGERALRDRRLFAEAGAILKEQWEYIVNTIGVEDLPDLPAEFGW
jgi:hypothetical protein